jgi:hypothetical protein
MASSNQHQNRKCPMKFPKNELMVCNNNTHLVNIPQNGGETKENYIVP